MATAQQILSGNLKALRKEKKLYQRDIAQRSGILASTYSRIETMEVVPNLSSIEKIADAMGVSVAELFRTGDITDRSLLEKFQMVMDLSDYNRNVVEILLDSLIEKDRLERSQEDRKKKRLEELERVRKS